MVKLLLRHHYKYVQYIIVSIKQNHKYVNHSTVTTLISILPFPLIFRVCLHSASLELLYLEIASNKCIICVLALTAI